MTIRILFVDDEQAVLDGLRRMLRVEKEWEVRYATSGPEALDLLEEEPAEIVVSDLLMPGMDGLDLLRAVRDRHPETVRIVLSGHADLESTMKLTGVAHQYLSKPCESEVLRDVVRRASGLRAKLTSPALVDLMSRMDRLPGTPPIYGELMALVRSPDASLARIGRIVARDPAMTAKVLQLVNSAFFGLRRSVSDPIQAVALLGIDNLVALVLGAHIFSTMRGAASAGIDLERTYRETLTVAVAAKEIGRAEHRNRDQQGEYYLAGMLHDCGRLVLAANMPDRYSELTGRDAGVSLSEAEFAVFGATHEDVGAYLVGLWGLPDAVVEAAAFHHDPSEAPSRVFGPLAAVHVARAVVEAGDAPPELDWDYLKLIGVEHLADDWIEVCRSVTLDD
ncbi:MAG: response regulator [Acidimicrobiia bacterium]|nr:response regulator [Acidimicrobiia bacterium]